MAFSADGCRIASGGFDKTLRIWDAASGQTTLILKGHREAIQHLAFVPDGRQLVSSGETVRIWDARSSQASRSIRAHAVSVTGLLFSPDGSQLASGGWHDHNTKIWTTATGQEHATLSGGGHPAAFAPGTAHLLTADSDGQLRLWDTDTGRQLWAVPDGQAPALLSADGRELTFAGTDHQLRVWNVAERRLLRTVAPPKAVDSLFAISPDRDCWVQPGP